MPPQHLHTILFCFTLLLTPQTHKLAFSPLLILVLFPPSRLSVHLILLIPYYLTYHFPIFANIPFPSIPFQSYLWDLSFYTIQLFLFYLAHTPQNLISIVIISLSSFTLIFELPLSLDFPHFAFTSSSLNNNPSLP